MKKLILCVMMATTFSAHAEKEATFKLKKPVMCADAQLAMRALQEKMGMMPFFVSFPEKNRNTSYMLLVGKDSKKWAVVESDGETACIVAEGMSLMLLSGPDETN